MGNREDFFNQYDSMMPKFCKPYLEFLKIGAEAVPESTKSVYDLGIGTGNFSQMVKNRIPDVKIYGIDLDEKQIEKASLKLKDSILYCQDIFSMPFPRTDCIISSLVTHHFDNDTRRKKLIDIAKNSKLFINFDMVLFPGYNLERTIERISEFTTINFLPEDAREIEKEMRQRDNPMPLEEKIELFESNGFSFKLLAEDLPYVVYAVSGNKN
jgi:SAM-dependent methyltransferase